MLQGEKRALAAYRFIRQVLPALLTLAGAVVLAIYPVAPTAHFVRGGFVIAGILLAVAGTAVAIFIAPTRNQLLEAIRSVHSHLVALRSPDSDRMSEMLSSLMADLGMTTTKERLSLFVHHDDGSWGLVGRYSLNAELRLPSQRHYKAGQGLVSQTWRDRQTYISDLPPTRQRWNNRVSHDFDMEMDEVRALRMQSLTYACFRVEARDGQPVGVLIAESERRAGVQPAVLDLIEAHSTVRLLAIECQAHLRGLELGELPAVKKLLRDAADS